MNHLKRSSYLLTGYLLNYSDFLVKDYMHLISFVSTSLTLQIIVFAVMGPYHMLSLFSYILPDVLLSFKDKLIFIPISLQIKKTAKFLDYRKTELQKKGAKT